MEKQQDGWDNLSAQSEEAVNLISINWQNEARSILNNQYSLQPDMLTGWMPKLPSCPIPLTYQNQFIQSIYTQLKKQNLYEIVYKGIKYINSVQLHKRYHYRWRYRERYQIKVNAVTDSINNVGLIQQQKYVDENVKECQISFDSNFQSGNLDLAIKIKKNQYDCFIRSDTNTKGHTNWYYFKVNNKKFVGTIQFNICNIVKKRNLYGKGMNPYCKITQKNINNNWTQNSCYDTQFVQRLCRYGTGKTHNQLQFKFDFRRQDMEVYFAYSIPYTYSNLLNFLDKIKTNPLVKISSDCQTFSGLELPLITISSQSIHKKSNVILTARIHPGQTNSSHMLEGFIKSLLQNTAISHKLLSVCNFYILPMMNPDGVVVGNYRTSFSGRDLNRKFDQIGSFLYPQINGLVDLIKKLKKRKQKIDYFFDFHSHSSKKNLFCYGPDHQQGTSQYLKSRVFVKIMAKQDTMFDYDKCIHTISEYKKTTARAYMIRKEAIPMTFTFQISNGLYSITNQIDSNYDISSIHKAGRIILEGLSEYSIYYLRQFTFNKYNARLSLNLNKKIPSLRKMGVRKSQNLSTSFQFLETNNHQLKDIIQQITQENEAKINLQQKFSDHEESQNDINEQELQELFETRKKYIDEDTLQNYNTRNRPNLKKVKSFKNISNQNSVNNLMKIASQKKLNKTNLNLKKNLENNLNSPVISTSKVGKYQKNRIYYQQTHPPNIKKITESINSLKKAIKQKKFPIIF